MKYTEFQTTLEQRRPIAEATQQTNRTPQFDAKLKT